ncbi:MAG: L-threonylcarbamoyladenylate synthase [Coprothermobacterota bacterium]|nr:L-threonylcarbamoyladenylate synthase [Coprothermobacterota bacterium]
MTRLVDPEEAARLVKCGRLGAFPTETVFGLGAHPFHQAALQRIYAVKGREIWQPLSLHIGQLPDLFKFSQDLPSVVSRLVDRFWPGPLALIVPASPLVPAEARSASGTVSFRYPSSQTCRLFLRFVGAPLAATSANKSGSLSPLDALDVEDEIGEEIDFLLEEGSSTCPRAPAGRSRVPLESTLVDLTEIPYRVLRIGAISLERLSAETHLPFQEAGPILSPLHLVLWKGSPLSIAKYLRDSTISEGSVVLTTTPLSLKKEVVQARLPVVGIDLFRLLARLQREQVPRIYCQDIWPMTTAIHRRLAVRTEQFVNLEKGEKTCI